MKKYKIEITETLQKVVEIDAESLEEALYKAKLMYRMQEVVLDESDFVEAEFEPFDNK